jgi:hypothetical protein
MITKPVINTKHKTNENKVARIFRAKKCSLLPCCDSLQPVIRVKRSSSSGPRHFNSSKLSMNCFASRSSGIGLSCLRNQISFFTDRLLASDYRNRSQNQVLRGVPSRRCPVSTRLRSTCIPQIMAFCCYSAATRCSARLKARRATPKSRLQRAALIGVTQAYDMV